MGVPGEARQCGGVAGTGVASPVYVSGGDGLGDFSPRIVCGVVAPQYDSGGVGACKLVGGVGLGDFDAPPRIVCGVAAPQYVSGGVGECKLIGGVGRACMDTGGVKAGANCPD